VTAILDAPMRANPFVPALRRLVEGRRDPEGDLGGLRAKSGCGSRLQTVRSKRSTVLISFSQGVSRNQALAGNTVNSRISQRLRPAVSVLADPLGLRPAVPSSSLRRKPGWLSLTWVSR